MASYKIVNGKKVAVEKKNYTIVDGRKVEQAKTTANTTSSNSGLSDSWNKDTVTLDEARQQSSEAGTYLQTQYEVAQAASGIVSTVDTEDAGISDSWNKDTVTLEEAKTQTSQAQAYLDAKTEQTIAAQEAAAQAQEQAQAESQASEPQPLPSHIDPESELGKAAIASGQYYNASLIPSSVTVGQRLQGSDLSERMASLLGVRSQSSGTGDEGTDVRRSPLYVKTVTEGKSIREQISGLFREGVEGATNEVTVPSSVQFSNDNYQTTYGIYQKAESLAGTINAKAGQVIDTAFEVTPIEQIYDFMLPDIITTEHIKSVNKGVVEGATSLIPLVGGVPLAAEIAVKEPEKIGASVALGTGLIVGSTVKLAKEDPARLIGNIAGAAIAGKALGKGKTLLSDEIRTAGKVEIPIETIAQENIITGKATFPTVPKNTSIKSVMESFKTTSELHPESKALQSMGGKFGIHVTKGELGKAVTITKGASETPGLYVGPDASLHFSGVANPKFKLFGLAKASKPEIDFIQMTDTARLPRNLRNNLPAANKFMWEDATKGKGYSTVKMESRITVAPTEPELVVPPGSKLAKVPELSNYYAKWKGRKIPVNVYESLEKGIKTKRSGKTGIAKTKAYRPDTSSEIGKLALITDSDLRSIIGSRSKGAAIRNSLAPSVPDSSLPKSNKSSLAIPGISRSSYPAGSSRKPSRSSYKPGLPSSVPSVPGSSVIPPSSGGSSGGSGLSGGSGGGSGSVNPPICSVICAKWRQEQRLFIVA